MEEQSMTTEEPRTKEEVEVMGMTRVYTRTPWYQEHLEKWICKILTDDL